MLCELKKKEAMASPPSSLTAGSGGARARGGGYGAIQRPPEQQLQRRHLHHQQRGRRGMDGDGSGAGGAAAGVGGEDENQPLLLGSADNELDAAGDGVRVVHEGPSSATDVRVVHREHTTHVQNANAAGIFEADNVDLVIPGSPKSRSPSPDHHMRRRRARRTSLTLLGVRIPAFWTDWLCGGGDEEEQQPGDHSLSNCDTIIHMLKGNIGTGILAMPNAIKNSGLLVGDVGLVIMSVICVHCMHMLVRCAHELQRIQNNTDPYTYPDVMEQAFRTAQWQWARRVSRVARMTINVFLCLTQLGFCCVYFVFIARNLKLVCDHHFGHLDYHVYMAITLPLMLLLCSVRNLKYLAPISMLANVLQLVGLGLIFFYLVQDLPSTSDRPLFASWAQLPLYFGTAIYAFEGIGVVLPLENQMRYPEDLRGYNGVLNTSMTIVTCLYIAVGFFGYLKYGDAVEGSVTLNLPVEEWLAQIVIVMMSLAIFFSYALQFYVPLELMLPTVTSYFPNRPLLVEYVFRYAMVLLTFGLAAAVPKLDLFISLVGAMSSSTLALLAPPVMDTIIFWEERRGKFPWAFFKNAFVFTVGFAGFTTGTFYSMKNVIHYFETGE